MVRLGGTDGEVAGSLRELAVRYAHQLGAYARIERVFGRGEGVVFQPLRPGAAPVGWVDSGSTLTVIAGDYGRLRFRRRLLRLRERPAHMPHGYQQQFKFVLVKPECFRHKTSLPYHPAIARELPLSAHRSPV